MNDHTQTIHELPLDLNQSLISLNDQGLSSWIPSLEKALQTQFSPGRNGNLPHWLSLLSQLPQCKTNTINLSKDKVQIGKKEEISATTRTNIHDILMQFSPWRKGPFDVFGIHIDSEWQSNIKWQRLCNHIEPLSNRRVLDVGGGNSYYGLRMLGAGADWVLDVDPSTLAISQITALRHFIQEPLPLTQLPISFESVPKNLHCFDTVFSMGVLYHRKSPFDHLEHLRSTLRTGGQLVLETLIIEGKKGEILIPSERYAQMRNVWFIPSLLELTHWLKRSGFKNVECINCSNTTTEEQRSTLWMKFHSLSHFLDPENTKKTIEGYPAPMRAILTAIA